MDSNFNLVLKEAIRILEERPHLKHYEALNEAKSIIKQKELSDGNLKSSRVNKNNCNTTISYREGIK